jgi:hypothetical protein
MSFADRPRDTIAPVVAAIWDKLAPGRSTRPAGRPVSPRESQFSRKIMAEVDALEKAPTLEHVETRPTDENVTSMTIKRAYRRRNGSWYQVPKDLKNKGE